MLAALGVLVTALLAPVAGQQAQAPRSASAEPQGLLTEFREQLVRLREGDDRALTPLQELADRLCADFDRCDAGDVLAFYAGLPPGARRRGLANEGHYLALRREVFEAGELELAGAEWARERERILAELRALILDVEVDGDFVPAAQALVLCAQIELRWLESSTALTPDEVAGAIDQVAEDARDAEALFEAAGQVTPRLELLWVLGRLERIRGRADASRASFRRCYDQATRVQNELFREQALQGLLTLAVDAGDVPEQERVLRRLATFRAPEESWTVASGWGRLLLNADHPERALEFVEQYAPREGAHPAERSDWHLLMGGALMRLGMFGQARTHFDALAGGPSSDLAQLALARLSIEAGRPEAALERLDRSGFRERLANGDLASWHALAGEAHLAAGHTSAALGELERALQLTDLWSRTTYGEAETTARSVMGEWQGLHTVALLAEAHALLGRPLDAVAAIEDSQSRSLRRNDAELRRALVLADLDDTRARITPGDVLAWSRHAELGLVTWVVGADFTVVAWAGPRLEARGDAAQAEAPLAPPLQTYARRIEVGRRELDDGVRRLREAAIADDRAGVKRIAGELRDVLFPAPLLERLRAVRALERSSDRWLVLLHGPLERLPLELLELDDAPLDRCLTTLTLPGLPASRPGEAPQLRSRRWILAGAPTDVAPWAELPGARRELDALRQLYVGPEPLAGEDFTVQAMRDALRGPDPLHVATHLVGECEHPARRLASVSLLLSGGELLCTHDVAEIGPRSPLVILSACATAEGRYVDAQGLGGMARAFLESGTRNVLVTLWPVEDRAARIFGEVFHRALEAGGTPSRAARVAREALRSRGWGPAAVGAFRVLGRD